MIQTSIFVCSYCKTKLEEINSNLKCLMCDKIFPGVNNIPDFLQRDIEPERKKKFVDKLSLIYETPLWYPIVYHLYGGLFIPSVEKTVEFIVDMLKIDGGIALDVACGTEMFTRSIAKKAKQVYGIDISMGMLRKAKKYAKRDGLDNIVLVRAEVENMPFPEDFFNGVSCCGALHLFPDVIEVLGEMNRVLKKGRKLAVMTFIRKRFLGIKRVYEHLERDHQAHIFDVDELKIYLKNTGYSKFRCNIYGSMILFEAEKS